MAEVKVENLTRRYGRSVALDNVSFDVRSGEFMTLLGPSGCGKSTTLNSLAGLEKPTSGRITIGGRCVFDGTDGIFVDARHRKLGLMFQSYALWPHMTVYKNLDFALELNKVRGAEAKRRIDEVLATVDMDAYADRFPGELSGGQQQRVALARTMVYRPAILLLDEPLSNLDAKLREKARIWLGDIQRKTGMTTIFVTHDQDEALALSDRIIVMSGGRIAQIGSPKEIYGNPASAYVADFVGASNILDGTVVSEGAGPARVDIGAGNEISVSVPPSTRVGTKVKVSVRPEDIEMHQEPVHGAVKVQVVSKNYLGSRTLLVVELGGQSMRVEVSSADSSGCDFMRIPADAAKAFV